MPDPHSFIRCLSDKFTPVRDQRGQLLGAIPRQADSAETITDVHGNMFPLMFAAQVCVMVDTSQGLSPAHIDGFVPLDDTDADLATPVAAEAEDC